MTKNGSMIQATIKSKDVYLDDYYEGQKGRCFLADVCITVDGDNITDVIKKLDTYLPGINEADLKETYNDTKQYTWDVMENKDGEQASETELRKWEEGKLDLWNATYTIEFKKLETIEL
jgi:hypothetical protein